MAILRKVRYNYLAGVTTTVFTGYFDLATWALIDADPASYNMSIVFDEEYDEDEAARAEGAAITTYYMDLKALLYGCSGAGLAPMTHYLEVYDWLPLQEPYAGLGYLRHGFGGETTTSPILSDNEVTDWILVELRDKNDPEKVIYNKAGLLCSDTAIIGADGDRFKFENVLVDDYYIAVKHRNHLGVMTAEALPPNTSIDFTDEDQETYTTVSGVNAQIVTSGVTSMIPGKLSPLGISKYYGYLGYKTQHNADTGFLPTHGLKEYDSLLDIDLDGYIDNTLEFPIMSGIDNGYWYFEQIPDKKLEIFRLIFEQEYRGFEERQGEVDGYAVRFNWAAYDSPGLAYNMALFGKLGIRMPVGETSDRPTSSNDGTSLMGLFRFNETTHKMEYHNGTAWKEITAT